MMNVECSRQLKPHAGGREIEKTPKKISLYVVENPCPTFMHHPRWRIARGILQSRATENVVHAVAALVLPGNC